jgi:hypothetical protein
MDLKRAYDTRARAEGIQIRLKIHTVVVGPSYIAFRPVLWVCRCPAYARSTGAVYEAGRSEMVRCGEPNVTTAPSVAFCAIFGKLRILTVSKLALTMTGHSDSGIKRMIYKMFAPGVPCTAARRHSRENM